MPRTIVALLLFVSINLMSGCGGSSTPTAQSTEDTRPKEVRETDDLMQKSIQKYQSKVKKRR